MTRAIKTLGLTLALFTAAVAAADNQLPFEKLDDAIKTFQTQSEGQQTGQLQELQFNYEENRNVAVARNLSDFAERARVILEAPVKDPNDPTKTTPRNLDDHVILALVALSDQANQQWLKNANAASDDLVTPFTRLRAQGPRYSVTNHWATQAHTTTDITTLRNLRTFFERVKTVCESKTTDKNDESYIVRLAVATINEINSLLVERAPLNANLKLPIAGIDNVVAGFNSSDTPARVNLIRSYKALLEQPRSTQELQSLDDFGQRVASTLADDEKAGKKDETVSAESRALTAKTLEALVKRDDLTATQVLEYFRRVTTATERMTAVNFWGEKIKDVTTREAGQRLVDFFRGAMTICREANQTDTSSEAFRFAKLARDKLNSLGNNK